MKKEIHPNSLKNLNPVKKGEVRNPAGRKPKVKTISDILGRIGGEKMPPKIIKNAQDLFPDASNMTMLEATLRMCYVHALKGNAWALQFIAERTEGKITQQIDISPFSEIDPELLNQLSIDELRALAGWAALNKKANDEISGKPETD